MLIWKVTVMKKMMILGIALVLALLTLPSCSAERKGAITLEGKPLTLLGTELKVGQKAPDFRLVAPYDYVEEAPNAEEVELSQSQGKVRLISVVPSLDTPVCDLQTRRFEEEASKFEDVVFYTISMDLPFAQARYCSAQEIESLVVLSDHRDASFGLAYGVLIKELRLLSRAIFIIDRDDTIRYIEYVKEISQPPDYDKALQALETVLDTSSTAKEPSSGTTGSVRVGDAAPDFQLDDLEGNAVSLSDFRGKPVLLNFWVTWCPHCRAERPWIQQIYNEWQDRGLVVLTVDMIGLGQGETPSNLRDYMRLHAYSFPVLLDANQKVMKMYGITGTPTNFFIDRNGIIQAKKTGPFPSKSAIEDNLNKIVQ